MFRRNFLRAGGITLAASAFGSRCFADEAKPPLFNAMGIAAPMEKAALMKAAGAQFLTVSVGDLLVPDQPDEAFAANLAKLKDCPLPVFACNGFIRPADLHCVGPEANHEAVLAWAETSFRRLKQVGATFMVFGSAGARRVPEGWPVDKATEQFVALLKRMGELAEKHDIRVVVEQLNDSECNFITRIGEGAAVIRAANHPRVRMLADLYHMAKMNDTHADLKAAMDVVVHVEIAEKEGRTMPGVAGDDFRSYFHVLRQANYKGAISIEGKYTSDDQLAKAFQEIARQAAEV